MGRHPAFATRAGETRVTLLARWNVLTRDTLPAMAPTHQWPIRLDHCFMRVCLDAALGARWDTLVRRPAVRHLTCAQLARAVAIAERITQEPTLLPSLNTQSLHYRQKRDPFRVGPANG